MLAVSTYIRSDYVAFGNLCRERVLKSSVWRREVSGLLGIEEASFRWATLFWCQCKGGVFRAALSP